MSKLRILIVSSIFSTCLFGCIFNGFGNHVVVPTTPSTTVASVTPSPSTSTTPIIKPSVVDINNPPVPDVSPPN